VERAASFIANDCMALVFGHWFSSLTTLLMTITLAFLPSLMSSPLGILRFISSDGIPIL